MLPGRRRDAGLASDHPTAPAHRSIGTREGTRETKVWRSLPGSVRLLAIKSNLPSSNRVEPKGKSTDRPEPLHATTRVAISRASRGPPRRSRPDSPPPSLCRYGFDSIARPVTITVAPRPDAAPDLGDRPTRLADWVGPVRRVLERGPIAVYRARRIPSRSRLCGRRPAAMSSSTHPHDGSAQPRRKAGTAPRPGERDPPPADSLQPRLSTAAGDHSREVAHVLPSPPRRSAA